MSAPTFWQVVKWSRATLDRAAQRHAFVGPIPEPANDVEGEAA